jgi:hypothetical protein
MPTNTRIVVANQTYAIHKCSERNDEVVPKLPRTASSVVAMQPTQLQIENLFNNDAISYYVKSNMYLFNRRNWA